MYTDPVNNGINKPSSEYYINSNQSVGLISSIFGICLISLYFISINPNEGNDKISVQDSNTISLKSIESDSNSINTTSIYEYIVYKVLSKLIMLIFLIGLITSFLNLVFNIDMFGVFKKKSLNNIVNKIRKEV